MLLLQTASPWPVNVAGWVELFIKAFVLGGMVGGVLGWWLKIKLNGLGTRVAAVETNCITHGATLADIKARQQQGEFVSGAASVALGEIKGMLNDLKEEFAKRRELDEKAVLRTAERLARIETKLNVPPDKG